MLFADIAEAGRRVSSTRSRREKVEILAGLIDRLAPDEIEPAVWFLAGGIRHGRVGVGYASAYSVEAEPPAEPSLTVRDVDRALGDIPGITGPGSQAERAAALARLFGAATLDEQDHLRRILVGEVRQGALEGIVVEAVAAAARLPATSIRRTVMLTGDIGEAARIALTEGGAGVADVGLRVMTPVKPMLASTSPSVEDAIDAAVSVDWKLDGARIQVHRQGDDVRVFTRNLNDVTDRMPEVVEVVAGLEVESVVLDGEAMALRPDGSPQSFQETMSRFGTEERAVAAVPLYPFFFDVMSRDGEPLIDRPLHERHEVLDRIVPDRHRIPRLVTDSADRAREFFDRALEAGHEGVVVKDLDSTYEAGRRGSTWRKVKPVYTYDLVVLAVEWGHGRRSGWLSNLHLGAREGDEFVMVGKTFKGLTDRMLEWQTQRFLGLEQRRTRSTVFVRPEQVVEVAIDGVQKSPRYPGGIALRFARVKRYRDDKAASEADTLEALRRRLPSQV